MPYYGHNDAVFYEDLGAGDPVLLLHGAVASGRQLEELAGHLASRFRVIVPDLRGMGRSMPASPVGAADWTHDVCSLLDALSLSQVHLAGTSLGARVAMRVALDHPNRIATLTVDAPIVANEPPGETALNRLLGPDMPAEFAALVETWQGGDGWRDVVASYSRARADPVLQEHYDLRDRLADLAVPVLVARGDNDDPIHPIAHAAEVHRAVSSSWLWIAPGTGFATMRFLPAQVAALFERFIEAMDARCTPATG